jgi:hypothetical protein
MSANPAEYASRHRESARRRAMLGEAIQRKAQVWLIAQKSDLALRDVLTG